MKINPSERIFASRDHDFDLCRSFLVVSMIFTHVFQNFYLPDYNRRLTFFVTIGFVLVSGFVIGGKNTDKVSLNPMKYYKNYLRRFFKLILVYFICNLPILFLEPFRLKLIMDTNLLSFSWMILSGGGSGFFAFDILPAIALTTLGSWMVMGATGLLRLNKNILLSSIPFLLLYFFEQWFGDNFITIRLLMVGIFGCLLGISASTINWEKILITISKSIFILGNGLIVFIYFSFINFHVWPSGPILLWRHLLPTTVFLFLIYILSYTFQLGSNRAICFLNATIGEYLLFAYIFHIGMIKFTRFFIESDLNFIITLNLCVLITIITIGTCYLLDQGRKRVALVSRVYSVMFGL